MPTLGIDAFISRREPSGVEWYTQELLRAMETCTPPGWDVFLYSLDAKPIVPISNPVWHAKQLRWFPRRGWGQIRLSYEMLRVPPSVLFVPGAAIPCIHPHQTITTIHDVGFLAYPDRYEAKDLDRQRRALDRARRSATKVLVPSRATSDALPEDMGTRVVVTPLGISHERYRDDLDPADVEVVRARYALEKPYLFYIGRIDRKKNLETLISAFLKSRSSKTHALVFAGSAGFDAEVFKKKVADANANDRIRFLGFVPEVDVPYLMAGAELFVFPSVVEGFGLPLLQALACGVPTLVSDIPAHREVAGEAARFVSPLDGEEWGRAIDVTIENRNETLLLARRGPTQASKFSWQKTAELTWAAITTVASQTKPR